MTFKRYSTKRLRCYTAVGASRISHSSSSLSETINGWRLLKTTSSKAAEKDYPQASIALYQELAEAAIARRSRGFYQQATSHLKRAKQLYGQLRATADWESYSQALRARHKTLRALQDELQQARR